jgi:hypothetical protein
MFRQSVVDRLSSPEELDRLMHVTSPRSWLFLVILFASLVAGVLWLSFTNIPTTLSAQGALTASPGSPGRLQAIVYVDPQAGDQIAPGMQVSVRVRHQGVQVSLPGTVRSVDDFAVTRQQMLVVVRNDAYARSLAAGGNVLPVHVALAARKAGGLLPGLVARATITLANQKAIKLVIP